MLLPESGIDGEHIILTQLPVDLYKLPGGPALDIYLTTFEA